ncbi:unnamed protein product [Tilletia controversa]|nr:unnamed protein product [Tilletia controversa]
MSAYPEFELLPPPPPTFLSTSSPRRAQLPRFANVDEVVQFARGQVLARRDPMIERSLFFVVIYIGLLVGLAASVIIRRIINRNFWLFRIVRRPDGLLLVPHLHNCWSFMAGSFGFVFTVYNGISLANLLRQQPPKDACITLIYVWSPLYLGISWMAWAAAVAGTQNLYIRIKITRRWSIKARIPPWVANMFGVGVPCSCAVAVLLPSILGNRHSENARRLFIEWNKQFATQEAITEDMLVQLQLIWFETIRHVNYLAIAAILWSIFASITLIIYLHFSVQLIRTLQRHLRRRGAKSGPIQNAMTMSMGVFTTDVVPDGGDEHVNRTVLSGNAVRNIDTKSAIALPSVVQSQFEVVIEDVCPTDKNIQPLARLPPLSLPPSPSPPSQPSPRSPCPRPMTDPESRQRDEAGSVARAVLYFVIQATSINLGTLIMASVAITLARVTVARTELGHFQNTVNICWMVLSFTCVLFGTTTLCSIAHETYEESLASLIHPTRRSQTDSAPFRLKPVTISAVERRRRMPQHETQTQGLQTETEQYGTAFEHLTLHLLRTVFGMSQLERTGGAGDRGIDLTGWWYPPPPPPSLTATTTTAAVARRVRVLVQCKYQSSTPLGPVHMRELEGTMYRKGFEARMLNDPDAQQTQEDTKSKDKNMIYRIPLLGILTSSTGFSSACARYSLASPFPLLLLHIPFSSSQQQALSTLTKQKGTTDSPVPSFAVLPNRAFVAPTGLMEGRLEFRSTRRIPTTADVEADEEVVREDGSAVEEAGDEVANELVLDTIDSPDILLDGRPLQERFPSA